MAHMRPVRSAPPTGGRGRGHGSPMLAVLQTLKNDPQEWYKISEFPMRNSASSRVSAIKKSFGKLQPFQAKDFEFTYDAVDPNNPDGKWGVWARYVGPR